MYADHLFVCAFYFVGEEEASEPGVRATPHPYGATEVKSYHYKPRL